MNLSEVQWYLCGVSRPFPELVSRQKWRHVRQRLRWRQPLLFCHYMILRGTFWLLAHRTALVIWKSIFPFHLGLSCSTVSDHTSFNHEVLPVFRSLSWRPWDSHVGFGHKAMCCVWIGWTGVGSHWVRAEQVLYHVLPVLVFVLLEKRTSQEHRGGLFIGGVRRIIFWWAKGWWGDGAGGGRWRGRWREAGGGTGKKTTATVGCDPCTSLTRLRDLPIILIILV